jgi:predicted TIM-barrel fold metal-dependent hydrolase
MAKRFSDAKLVLAHWGGGIFFYSLLKKEVRDVLKNVYFDTAASPFLYEPRIYQHAIDCIGHDRILFGTDYPLIKPSRYFKEMDAAGLSGKARSAICGDNAARLLGIAPPVA